MRAAIFLIGLIVVSIATAATVDPAVLNNLGYHLAAEGQVNAAKVAFLHALELDPTYVKARENLATLAFQQEEYGLAIVHLGILLQGEERATWHFDLAQNLVAKARFKETDNTRSAALLSSALTHFDRVLEIEPDFPHAASNAKIVQNVLA